MRKISILFVEDDPLVRHASKGLFSNYPHKLTVVDRGLEALHLLDRSHYDIIFMDFGLPDVDGFVTTETIRKLKPAYQKIPIIGITANFADLYRARGQAVGITDFLVKPLTITGIKKIFLNYLGIREPLVRL